ncbi:AI-2E family transporter [Chroococcidiopsidales cyanobacterium LEGE 13417]|nr:AI-2E family transporter [Chroococcidiopsidales cyanobacterium LEGE 13417]
MNGSKNKLWQWLAIALPFPLLVFNGWLALLVFQYFQPLIAIFGLAAVLAFILNYPVQWLQQRQVQRQYAVFLVFLIALVTSIALGITLIPLLVEELSEGARLLPQWIDAGTAKLKMIDTWVETQQLPFDLTHLTTQVSDRLPDELQFLGEELVMLIIGTIDSVSEAILTVVLTFYLLLDGERLWRGVFGRLPSRWSIPLQRSLQQNFQNYLIGQVALAALVGTDMTLAFVALGVPFGLLFGLGIGAMTLIPFGDVLSFSLVGLLVAVHDFWLGAKTLAVAVVVDQIIDQAIAPRLLGSFTGLSPIGVLIALAVGTKIGGLLGLITAVPIASCLKNLFDLFLPVSEDALNPAETLHFKGSRGKRAEGAGGVEGAEGEN